MEKLAKGIILAFIAIMAACTNEKEAVENNATNSPGEQQNQQTQEVILNFKNKLSIKNSASKASTNPIATTSENYIKTLDVYVFAADSEDGNYTFQERMAYRQDESELPQGCKEIAWEPAAEENQYTALLSLKKGLFVKLYCIANQPALVDPANQGNIVTDTYFQPLIQTNPGQQGSKVKTEGIPAESVFLTFHTPFIADAEDSLIPPLPMSGAYIQPIDLTDYAVSARIQAGLKLTRAVARFDIVNRAAESRFTIDSIAMKNARKSITFFPMEVYGDQPVAKTQDLITLPATPFAGEKANEGNQKGAFYSFPALLQDQATLILIGRTQVNQTETKQTRYEVPFKQTAADGSGAYIEIQNNHRYTITVTPAEEYNLRFLTAVADWNDEESVDNYTPDNRPEQFSVTIPDNFAALSEWKKPDTLNLSLDAGSYADLTTASNSSLLVTKTYAGKSQLYDWLDVSEAAVTTKAAAFNCTYRIAPKDGYDKKNYPRACLRFTSLANAEEKVFFVEAVAVPQPEEISKTPGDRNPNSFDASNLLATLYRNMNSILKIKLLCPNGVDVVAKPDWIQADPQINGNEIVYTLTLTDRETTDTEGEIVFANKKASSLQTRISIKLIESAIQHTFVDTDKNGNAFTPSPDGSTGNVTLNIVQDNTFKVTTRSIEGIQVKMDFNGNPEWLAHNGEATGLSASVQKTITFSQVNSKLNGAKPVTVTLVNRLYGAPDYTFTVTPKFNAPVLQASSASQGSSYTNETMWLHKSAAISKPTVTLSLYAGGGYKLTDAAGNPLPAWIQVTKMEDTAATTSCTFTLDTEDASFPAAFPTSGYTFYAANANDNSLKQPFTVKAKSDLIVTQKNSTYKASFDAANNRMRLYNNANDKVTLSVYCIGGTTLGKPSWLNADKTTSANNTETYTFHVADNGSTGVNGAVTFTRKIDNTTGKSFTAYSIKKELTLSAFSTNYDSKSNAYATNSGFTGSSPAIAFFPANGAQCSFKVRSPMGSGNDNPSWLSFSGSSDSQVDANTGEMIRTITIVRYGDDNKFASMQSAFNLSLTNNYTDGGNLSVRMTQMAPVYPGSSIKPAILDGQNADYFWAPVRLSNNQVTFANRLSCPTGWRYATRAEYVDMMWGGNSAPFANYVNNTAKNNGIIIGENGEWYYWSSEAYYYISVKPAVYRVNSNGASDTNYCRCIQKK